MTNLTKISALTDITGRHGNFIRVTKKLDGRLDNLILDKKQAVDILYKDLKNGYCEFLRADMTFAPITVQELAQDKRSYMETTSIHRWKWYPEKNEKRCVAEITRKYDENKFLMGIRINKTNIPKAYVQDRMYFVPWITQNETFGQKKMK